MRNGSGKSSRESGAQKVRSRRAWRVWLGGVGLSILGAASVAHAEAKATAPPTGITINPITVCLDISCMSSAYTTYMNQLAVEPQNAAPDTFFVNDADGGSFEPKYADQRYYQSSSRSGYHRVVSHIAADGGVPQNPGSYGRATPPPNSTWSALESQAQFDALSSNEASTGVPYVRNASWVPATGGTTIDSCQKYVYHSFYDLERWMDAVNACGDDTSCKVRVSITGNGRQASYPPAIDRDTLKDSDGNPIDTRIQQLISAGLADGSSMVYIEPPPFWSDILGSESAVSTDAYAIPAGSMPKNAFYVGTEQFVVPELSSLLAQAQITGLQNEINNNHYTYVVGSTYNNANQGHVGGATWTWTYPGTTTKITSQGFASEWDFHATMNQRTNGMTLGEMKEYRSRQQNLVNALQQLADPSIPWCSFGVEFYSMTGNMAGWLNGCTNAQQVAHQPVASVSLQPYQSAPDPWVTPEATMSSLLAPTSVATPVLLAPSAAGLASVNAANLAASLAASRVGELKVSRLSSTSGSASGSASPGAGLSTDPRFFSGVIGNVPQPPPKGQVVSYVQRAWEILPPILNDSRDVFAGLNCGVEFNAGWLSELKTYDQMIMQYLWRPVCNATSALVVEYLRAQAGAPSCMSDSNYRCDWSPQMFADRFISQYYSVASHAKEAEYAWCKRWSQTTGSDFSSTLGSTDDIFKNNGNLATFRNLLAQREAKYDKIMKNVPIAAANTLGTTKADSSQVGNSLFSAGYSYDLGWTATITQRDANQVPCEWGGTLNAEFDANATVLGITEELVSAGMAMSAIPNDQSNTTSGTVAAHLRLIDSDVFQPFSQPATFNGSDAPYTPTGSGLGVNETHTPLLGPTGMPFQAGPVTITVNAGIEYGYGAVVTFTTNDSVGCLAVPTFGLSATINPTANFGVWAWGDATVLGFGAGVETELTLLQVGLPLTASVQMEGNQPDPVDSTNAHLTTMNTQFGLALQLSTLGGQVDIYGVVFGFHVDVTPIVKWQGVTWTVPLFHTPEVAIPLPYLQNVSPTADSPQSGS